jgi:hypothetical protein
VCSSDLYEKYEVTENVKPDDTLNGRDSRPFKIECQVKFRFFFQKSRRKVETFFPRESGQRRRLPAGIQSFG